MSEDYKCPICKIEYNRNNRKAYILLCGHSSCSECINFHKEAKRDIECGKCCKLTQSANIENQACYQNNDTQTDEEPKIPDKDEFEIYIRKKTGGEKFSMLVKKNMKLKELIDKIESQEDIKPTTYELCFKKPLTEEDKTLEYYGITRTCTITMITKFDGGK